MDLARSQRQLPASRQLDLRPAPIVSDSRRFSRIPAVRRSISRRVPGRFRLTAGPSPPSAELHHRRRRRELQRRRTGRRDRQQRQFRADHHDQEQYRRVRCGCDGSGARQQHALSHGREYLHAAARSLAAAPSRPARTHPSAPASSLSMPRRSRATAYTTSTSAMRSASNKVLAPTGTVDNTGQKLTLSGDISGTGGLVFTNSSPGAPFAERPVLSGTNSYTGGTAILGTTVQANNSSVFGSGDVTLDFGTVQTKGSNLTLTNNLILANTINFGGVTGGFLDASGATLRISGNISGPGALEIVNSTFTFSSVILTAPPPTPAVRPFASARRWRSAPRRRWEALPVRSTISGRSGSSTRTPRASRRSTTRAARSQCSAIRPMPER